MGRRQYIDKYICPKCKAFCGLITTDRVPDPPECDRNICPARVDLAIEPIHDPPGHHAGLTPRQAAKLEHTDS